MMKKKSIYLDTTFPSYLFDDRTSVSFQTQITQKWWNEESHHFSSVTSSATLNELERGHYPKKKDVLTFISNIELLAPHPDIISIVDIYPTSANA